MRRSIQLSIGFAAGAIGLSSATWAQTTDLSTAPLPYGQPELVEGAAPEPYGPPPIPPEAEAQPLAGPGGSYCYAGPHPVDTRVAAGPAWDDSQGPHTHFYAPFDTRLFTVRGGCYHFVGDPSDFGYRGQTYGYYGAHPVHGGHGGGWCFMIGGHSHGWQPWSPQFVVVGPWYYWPGPYDRHFWSYWPYYSHYYRSYYPHYYAGGRFGRGRDGHVAPRIDRVPGPYPRRGYGRATPPPAVDRPSGWSGHGWRGGAPTATPPAASAQPPRQIPGARGGAWSGGNRGWAGGAPATTTQPAPAVRQPMPATPVPSGAHRGGGGNPNRIGAARGGWRN